MAAKESRLCDRRPIVPPAFCARMRLTRNAVDVPPVQAEPDSKNGDGGPERSGASQKPDRRARAPRRDRLDGVLVEHAVGALGDVAEMWRQHDVVEPAQ